MKLRFEEAGQAVYSSGSQSARVKTERWVSDWIYCPNCGNPKINQFSANRPVADFFCPSCSEQFELKSQKGKFGTRIVDGAFRTMIERLSSDSNPNLLLLNYNNATSSVTDALIIPKHFFIPEIIEERKPLAPTARRAGWIGCNILLKQIPESGKIFFVRNGVLEQKELVLAKWRQTLFLRDQSTDTRSWLVEVMKCVESIGKIEFHLAEVYAFENKLSVVFPNNRHIREKIRQQLQFLRDRGYLDFVSPGHYRLRNA